MAKTKNEEKKRLTLDDYREPYRLHRRGTLGYESQQDVADRLGVTKSTVGVQFRKLREEEIERLKKKKVDRTLDPKRERVKYVLPTQLELGAFQPRKDETLDPEFVEDIRRAGGNIAPVLIREEGETRLQVVGGHLRVLAIAQINEDLPLEDKILVYCVTVDQSKKQAAFTALRDNLLHKDLTTNEENAWLYKLISEFGATQEEICLEFGKKPETVSNIFRAFDKAAPPLRELLDSGELSVSHAKAIVSLDAERQTRIIQSYKKSQEKGKIFSVSDFEARAQEYRASDKARTKISEHLVESAKGKKKLRYKGDLGGFAESVLAKVYPGRAGENGYTPRRTDVQAAIRDSGIEVEFEEVPTPKEKAQKAYDKVLENGKEKPEPPKSPCTLCMMLGREDGKCARGKKGTPKKPGTNVDDCFIPLGGYSQAFYVPTCKHCGGILAPPSALEGVNRFSGEHCHCTIQELVKEKRLSGPCESCQAKHCSIVQALTHRPNVKLVVEQCDTQYEELPGTIEEINATVQDALEYLNQQWREAKESKAEESETAKA